jgi:hypothetical protein
VGEVTGDTPRKRKEDDRGNLFGVGQKKRESDNTKKANEQNEMHMKREKVE